MSALEGHSGDSPSEHRGRGAAAAAAAAGAGAGYVAGRRRAGDDHSSSDGFGDSPESERGAAGVLRPPPTTLRRNGSLSSGSVLAGEDPQSPSSVGGMSSPQGMASQQSEQLPFFKDYYSQDDIHPGDRVAVLWAYQPRAPDEFGLDRGDMLKVVGIWDDGWATGVLVDERAEEWEARRQAQRDSGVSNTSGRGRDTSPPSAVRSRPSRLSACAFQSTGERRSRATARRRQDRARINIRRQPGLEAAYAYEKRLQSQCLNNVSTKPHLVFHRALAKAFFSHMTCIDAMLIRNWASPPARLRCLKIPSYILHSTSHSIC